MVLRRRARCLLVDGCVGPSVSLDNFGALCHVLDLIFLSSPVVSLFSARNLLFNFAISLLSQQLDPNYGYFPEFSKSILHNVEKKLRLHLPA